MYVHNRAMSLTDKLHVHMHMLGRKPHSRMHGGMHTIGPGPVKVKYTPMHSYWTRSRDTVVEMGTVVTDQMPVCVSWAGIPMADYIQYTTI